MEGVGSERSSPEPGRVTVGGGQDCHLHFTVPLAAVCKRTAWGESGHGEPTPRWVIRVGDDGGLDRGVHSGNKFSPSVQEMKMMF